MQKVCKIKLLYFCKKGFFFHTNSTSSKINVNSRCFSSFSVVRFQIAGDVKMCISVWVHFFLLSLQEESRARGGEPQCNCCTLNSHLLVLLIIWPACFWEEKKRGREVLRLTSKLSKYSNHRASPFCNWAKVKGFFSGEWLTINIISVKFKVLGCLMIAIGEPFVNVQEAAKHLQNINGDEFLRQTFLLLPAADCWRREGQSFSRSYWTPLFGVLKARGREEKKWANKEWN